MNQDTWKIIQKIEDVESRAIKREEAMEIRLTKKITPLQVFHYKMLGAAFVVGLLGSLILEIVVHKT